MAEPMDFTPTVYGRPLPSPLLRIKRKKDEEPVDALYIQPTEPQQKRRYLGFAFRRITIAIDGGSHVPRPLQDSTVFAARPGPDPRSGSAHGRETVGVLSDDLSVDDGVSAHSAPNSAGIDDSVRGRLPSTELPDTVAGINPVQDGLQHSASTSSGSPSKPAIRRFHFSKLLVEESAAFAGRRRRSQRADKASVGILLEEITDGRRAPFSSLLRRSPPSSAAAVHTMTAGDASPGKGKAPMHGQGARPAPGDATRTAIGDDERLVPSIYREMLEEVEPPKDKDRLLKRPGCWRKRDGPTMRRSDGDGDPDGLHPDEANHDPIPTITAGKPTSYVGSAPPREDSDGYVTDTYERVPPSHLEGINLRSDRVGEIVLDEAGRETFEQVYLDEREGRSASEDEVADDDEDENAENWYGNDYPEDPGDEDEEDEEDDRGHYEGRGPGRYPEGSYDDGDSDLDEYRSALAHWMKHTPSGDPREEASDNDVDGDGGEGGVSNAGDRIHYH
ncbi:MAG: hypothetical protein M1826_006746 [Phylliscum demangeonii]|nr:MAG: hypothetical protein M1826_006746 [Phylliscum demangeonii]